MQRALLSYLALALAAVSACGSNQKRLFADEAAHDVAFAAGARPEWLWEPPSSGRVPQIPRNILGAGRLKSSQLARFLVKTNPFVDKKFAEKFAKLYVEEAALEGVNHDVAFSQMCLETGFLSFGGTVTPDMNNFCGLGSLGPGVTGERFPTPRIGIRAQIQHLKVYATDAPLNQKSVDPRRQLVIPGSAPTIDDLAGSWAEDLDYGKKISDILSRLYALSF